MGARGALTAPPPRRACRLSGFSSQIFSFAAASAVPLAVDFSPESVARAVRHSAKEAETARSMARQAKNETEKDCWALELFFLMSSVSGKVRPAFDPIFHLLRSATVALRCAPLAGCRKDPLCGLFDVQELWAKMRRMLRHGTLGIQVMLLRDLEKVWLCNAAPAALGISMRRDIALRCCCHPQRRKAVVDAVAAGAVVLTDAEGKATTEIVKQGDLSLYTEASVCAVMCVCLFLLWPPQCPPGHSIVVCMCVVCVCVCGSLCGPMSVCMCVSFILLLSFPVL